MEESSATMFDFLPWFTAVCVAVHIINLVVISNQLKVTMTEELPEPLEGHATDERYRKFIKAQFYWYHRGLHDTFRELFRMLAIGFTIFYRLDAWLWEIAGNFVKDHGYSQENEIIHSLAYLALHFLSLESVEFPFALWNFFVKAKYGFDKTPRRQFCLNQIRKATHRSLIRTVEYVGYIFALKRGGPYASFYLWTWDLGVTIFNEKIFSNWSSKPTPLPAGELLRENIQNLAEAASFPLRDVYVVNGSTDINVHVRDWSKCIFLSNTFTKKYEDGEVVAAIAHELGRWRSNHKIYSFIAYQAYMLLERGLFVLISSLGGLFVGLGFKTQPSVIEIVMYLRGLNALRNQGGIVYNLFNRSFVYKADTYAMELGHTDGLQAYLIKEELKDNYARHIYPPHSALRNSIPTLIERLIEIDRICKRTVPARADEECAYRGCWEFLRGLWNWLRGLVSRKQKTEENIKPKKPKKKKTKKQH